MLTIINTPRHALMRQDGISAIHHKATGRLTVLEGVDAAMLDIDLAGITMRAVDCVLSRYEVQS